MPVLPGETEAHRRSQLARTLPVFRPVWAGSRAVVGIRKQFRCWAGWIPFGTGHARKCRRVAAQSPGALGRVTSQSPAARHGIPSAATAKE